MKNAFQSSMFLFSLLLAGCSQIDYNHPLDSNVTYDNPNYFEDSDKDGIANLWDEDDSLFIVNQDREAPVLTLKGKDTVSISFGDSDALEQLKSQYEVTDNKDSNPEVIVTADFSVEFPNTNVMKYTATDKSTNSVTVYRIVIVLPQAVEDIIKPDISVPQVDIEIYQYEEFDPMKNVTAWDETDQIITDKIELSGEVNTDKTGTYTVIYTVEDNAGNADTLIRNITVIKSKTVDNDFPVITLIGSSDTIIGLTDEWIDPGYKAYDSTDGDITNAVKVIGEVEEAAGTYTLTYSVSDEAMHNNSATRIVRRGSGGTTGDTVKPVITLVNKKDTVVTVIKGGTFTVPEVKIKDNIDDIPDDSIKVYGSINTNVVGTYSVTLMATDKSNNSGQLSIKVNVIEGTVDKTPPVITIKGNNPDTVGVSTTGTYKDSGATATDNSDGDITAKISKSGTVDLTEEGNYTITYIVEDAAGNADTASRVVVVKEGIQPSLFTKYSVPAATALATLNGAYTSAVIDGDATSAPDLSSMSEFKINWNKTQKSIYDISINMSGTINYVDLKTSVTHTLDKTEPTITFTGVTKISKFDGEYYVTVDDDDNFVMVKTDGSFAIVMKP